MANDPALEQLANMLKRVGHQRVMENPNPPTPSSTVRPSIPQLGAQNAYQPPPSMLPPMGSYMAQRPPQTPPAGPPPSPTPAPLPPPQAVQAAPAGVPAMPQPTQIGPAASPSVWDTFKKMLASGQVPEGYRGAMGEMVKNV